MRVFCPVLFQGSRWRALLALTLCPRATQCWRGRKWAGWSWCLAYNSALVMHLLLFPSYLCSSGFPVVWVFVLNCTTGDDWMQNECIRSPPVWALPTLGWAHCFQNVVTVCLGRCQCKCEENGHRTRLLICHSGSCLYQLH